MGILQKPAPHLHAKPHSCTSLFFATLCPEEFVCAHTRSRGTPHASLTIGALCVASRVCIFADTHAEKAPQSFLHTANMKNTTMCGPPVPAVGLESRAKLSAHSQYEEHNKKVLICGTCSGWRNFTDKFPQARSRASAGAHRRNCQVSAHQQDSAVPLTDGAS